MFSTKGLIVVRTGEQFWIWESHIPKELCEGYKQFFMENKDKVTEGTVGDVAQQIDVRVDPQKRKTDLVWQDDPYSQLSLLMWVHILRANFNAKWLVDIRHIEPVQLGRYASNGFYGWHQDESMGSCNVMGLTRKLSASLILSDPSEYEGGDLILRLAEEVVVPKTQGTLVVFPSYTIHQVTPVTSGERFSAVAWALGNEWR